VAREFRPDLKGIATSLKDTEDMPLLF